MRTPLEQAYRQVPFRKFTIERPEVKGYFNTFIALCGVFVLAVCHSRNSPTLWAYTFVVLFGGSFLLSWAAVLAEIVTTLSQGRQTVGFFEYVEVVQQQRVRQFLSLLTELGHGHERALRDLLDYVKSEIGDESNRTTFSMGWAFSTILAVGGMVLSTVLSAKPSNPVEVGLSITLIALSAIAITRYVIVPIVTLGQLNLIDQRRLLEGALALLHQKQSQTADSSA